MGVTLSSKVHGKVRLVGASRILRMWCRISSLEGKEELSFYVEGNVCVPTRLSCATE